MLIEELVHIKGQWLGLVLKSIPSLKKNKYNVLLALSSAVLYL